MENKKITIANKIHKDLWLTQLTGFLYNIPLNGEELSIILKIINYFTDIKEKNIEIEDISYDEENKQQRLFNYLDSIKEKFTPEYLTEIIDFSTANKTKEEFIERFIRYLIITNPEDIKIISTLNNKDNTGTIVIYLDQYPLGDVELFKTPEGVLFQDVSIAYNARGIGIGTMLMNKTMEEVATHFPNDDLYGTDLLKSNKRAYNFYEKLGATITPTNLNDLLCVTFPKSLMKEVKRKSMLKEKNTI